MNQPSLDPSQQRVDEALRLQIEFMEREPVLDGSDVPRPAGGSNRSSLASRWRKAGRIFSVSYRGQDYFPSFQFADDGQPLSLIFPLLVILRTEGMTDWDVAFWFTTPNGLLSGQVPKALLRDPHRESAARMEHAARQEVASDDE